LAMKSYSHRPPTTEVAASKIRRVKSRNCRFDDGPALHAA